MDSIYFIGVGQAIFIAALLGAKERRTLGDYILLVWMLLSAVNLVFFYLNFVGATEKYTPAMIMLGCFPFLTAPLVYLYVVALCKPSFQVKWIWPHGLPYVIVTVFFIYYYFFEAAPGEIRVADGFIGRSYKSPFLVLYYPYLLAASSLIYPLLSLIMLIMHQRIVLNEFSFQESITLKWLRNWIILELVGFFISFTVIHVGSTDAFDIVWSFRVLASLISINIFVVGFFGLRQPIIFPAELSKTEEVPPSAKYQSSGLNDVDAKAILEKLETRMKTDQLYIRQSLSITDLALELDASKHHLSQVINENLGSNFYDFVNRYRVHEIKRRLEDPKYNHLTMLGIALSCGFSSKSSFNQVFKRLEGMTPSQYRANRSNPINSDVSN